MKAFLLHKKRILSSLLVILAVFCFGCAARAESGLDESSERSEEEEAEADEAASITVPMHSSSRETFDATFVRVYESKHAVAYVSAHAINGEQACELSEFFDTSIFPMLPVPAAVKEKKLNILIGYMEGNVYGYMPYDLQETDYAPVLCLNALYPEDLPYALAHEYQHLCAYDACKEGGLILAAETDELLSEIFCELLFPGYGQERGISSETRAMAAREKIVLWGEDCLPYVYPLLRKGYTGEEMLTIMDNR